MSNTLQAFEIKIYPEWNVNLDFVQRLSVLDIIKIYPEWNVNLKNLIIKEKFPFY